MNGQRTVVADVAVVFSSAVRVQITNRSYARSMMVDALTFLDVE